MRGNYYFAGVMIKLESAGNKGGEMANIPGIVAKALIMAAGDWPSYSFFWEWVEGKEGAGLCPDQVI